MKISAPILDNQLPSFYSKEKIEVPFSLPSSVGPGDVKTMTYQISLLNNELKVEGDVETILVDEQNNWFAILAINTTDWDYGFYRVRLAFENSGMSNAAIIKYIPEPKVEIVGLNEDDDTTQTTYIGATQSKYIGRYKCVDQSEKVVSYSFEMYDNNSQLIVSSGEIIHNVLNNTSSTESEDVWSPTIGLDKPQLYKIIYKITTNTGMNISSKEYTLLNSDGIKMPNKDKIQLITEYNSDNGLVNISLNLQEKIYGDYILLRKSDKDEYKYEEELCRLKLGNQGKIFVYTDNTLEHGCKYKYCIRRYNAQGVFSEALESSKIITGEFEDIFLSDQERQLKIRFNPKVGSFKDTVLETKTDTIGGKYPVFYRNANVKYKEFSLSGLISVLSDENRLFSKNLTFEKLYRDKTPMAAGSPLPVADTQLTAENFDNEKEFKLQVLEWLTNGQPKLFRSAAEGAYIVRLMNVSLTPNDTLGRMIHTFNATAYEVAPCNLREMRNNSILSSELLDLRQLMKETETTQFKPGTHVSIQEDGKEFVIRELHSAPLLTFVGDGTQEIMKTNENGIYRFKKEQFNSIRFIWTSDMSVWPIGTNIYQEYYENIDDEFDSYKSVSYILSDLKKYELEDYKAEQEEILPVDKQIILIPYLSFSRKPKGANPSVAKRAWINGVECDFKGEEVLTYNNLIGVNSIEINGSTQVLMLDISEHINKGA